MKKTALRYWKIVFQSTPLCRVQTLAGRIWKRLHPHQMHSISLKSVCLATLFSALGIFASATAGVISQQSIQALMVTETAANGGIQTTASVGPLSDSAGYAGQSITGSSSTLANQLAVVPANASLNQTVYANNQDAQNAVTSYLNSGGYSTYIQQIAQAMTASMKSGSATGSQLGLFTFIQNVQIASPTGGTPNTAQVYASIAVYPNGTYQFLGANINNNVVYLLYAIYQQSRDAYYLPAGWTMPYAGELQWELDEVTIEGNTMQSAPVAVNGSIWHTIQDNGAYDGTVATNGSSQTVSYGPAVNNLVTQQVSPLMKQYNASLGVLLYGTQVKVARNGSGQPLTAIAVNSRILQQSCGGAGTYTNSGQYGYLLNETENEYIIQSSGGYSMAGNVENNILSPTANYNESAQVPSTDNATTLGSDIVFPIAPDQGQIFNWQAGTPLPTSDYTYVAPLQQQQSGHWVLPVTYSGQYGFLNTGVANAVLTLNGSSFDLPASGYNGFLAFSQSVNIPVITSGNSAYLPVTYSGQYGFLNTGVANAVLTLNGSSFVMPASDYYGVLAFSQSVNIPLVCQP